MAKATYSEVLGQSAQANLDRSAWLLSKALMHHAAKHGSYKKDVKGTIMTAYHMLEYSAKSSQESLLELPSTFIMWHYQPHL